MLRYAMAFKKSCPTAAAVCVESFSCGKFSLTSFQLYTTETLIVVIRQLTLSKVERTSHVAPFTVLHKQ